MPSVHYDKPGHLSKKTHMPFAFSLSQNFAWLLSLSQNEEAAASTNVVVLWRWMHLTCSNSMILSDLSPQFRLTTCPTASPSAPIIIVGSLITRRMFANDVPLVDFALCSNASARSEQPAKMVIDSQKPCGLMPSLDRNHRRPCKEGRQSSNTWRVSSPLHKQPAWLLILRLQPAHTRQDVVLFRFIASWILTGSLRGTATSNAWFTTLIFSSM